MKENITGALFTDFYELTMAQGYWKNNMNMPVVFEMFFRKNPFNSGFSVLAGVHTLFKTLETFNFSKEDICFLREQKIFEEDFLSFLQNWHFTGDVFAMEEGSVVFPQEPVLRVHANLIDAQIIEGIVLNTVNFQSLIATKTARIWLASKKSTVMEFGLRRAHGPDGAISAARAALIGGALGTSNTLAAKLYDVPAMGTMAHSWIMSHNSELEAFEKYAELYPDNSVFLIDTYDTLNSGLKNAITVGKKLAKKGKNFGIRLDSGDIDYLSRKVRKELDKEGLTKATICASNELNEEIISTLVARNAPIDSWGVGTSLVTGGNEASFSGVYKLAAKYSQDSKETIPAIKLSDNPEKTTNPGIKNVYRLYDEDGMAYADILSLQHEEIKAGTEYRFYHPIVDYQQFNFTPAKAQELLTLQMKAGKYLHNELTEKTAIEKARKNMETQLEYFDPSFKRILNPHVYKVSLSQNLHELKRTMILAGLGNS